MRHMFKQESRMSSFQQNYHSFDEREKLKAINATIVIDQQ